MELMELVKKLDECRKELEKIGAYGGFLFDDRYNEESSVAVMNEDFPKGFDVKYDTSVYPDKVVKEAVVGNVHFYSLISNEEAYNEGVMLYETWGALI